MTGALAVGTKSGFNIIPSLGTIEIVTSFVQYLALTAVVDVNWPKAWTIPMKFLNFLAIDLVLDIPSFPDVDARAQFVVVGIAVPLLFTLLFAVMMAFRQPKVLVWYISLLVGASFFVAGTVTRLLPSTPFSDNSALNVLSWVGGVMLLICFVTWAMRNAAGNEKLRERFQMKALSQKHKVIPPKIKIRIRNVLITSVLFIMGGLATGLFIPTMFEDSEFATLRSLSYGVGVIFLFLATLAAIYTLLQFSNRGRHFLDRVATKISGGFLKVLLLSLAVLYIPVTSSLISILQCESGTCPKGTEFANKVVALYDIEGSFTATNEVCTSCDFTANTCTSAEAAALCPEVTDMRLTSDATISCEEEIYPFYYPASIIMIFSFTLGVPALYYKLIKVSISALEGLDVTAQNREDVWIQRVSVTKSSCASLYSAFEWRWRYFKLWMMAIRFALVTMSVFLVAEPLVLLSAFFITHLVFAIVSWRTTPYLSELQDMLSIGTALLNAFNALVGVWIAANNNNTISDSFAIFVLLCNAVVPIVLAVAGHYLERKRRKDAYARLHKGNVAALRPETNRSVDSLDSGKGADTPHRSVRDTPSINNNRNLGYPGSIGGPDDDGSEMMLLPGSTGFPSSSVASAADTKPQTLRGPATPSRPIPTLNTAAAISMQQSGGERKEPNTARKKRRAKILAARQEADKERQSVVGGELDRALNQINTKILEKFFLWTGVLALGAFTICLIGLMQSSATSQYVSSDTFLPTDTNDYYLLHEYVGYDSWADFTNNCCCQDGAVTGVILKQEVWSCENGYKKQKLRVVERSGVEYSGLELRAFCGTTFESGVSEPRVPEDEDEYYNGERFFLVDTEAPAPVDLAPYTRRKLW